MSAERERLVAVLQAIDTDQSLCEVLERLEAEVWGAVDAARAYLAAEDARVREAVVAALREVRADVQGEDEAELSPLDMRRMISVGLVFEFIDAAIAKAACI